MIIICNTPTVLDNLEKIARIIIAALTLLLAFYVFVYNRKKDNINKKMQWFKELFIEPNISQINAFYENLYGLNKKITTNEIDEETKIAIISFIKEEQSKLRKSFLNVIQNIAPDLFDSIHKNLDDLTDSLTNCISNDELKLCNAKTYNREVYEKVQESNKFVLEQIFKYEWK